MITGAEIKRYLETVAFQQPTHVRGKIERGSRIPIHDGLRYVIDDPDIDKQLGSRTETIREGAIPYRIIHNFFSDSHDEPADPDDDGWDPTYDAIFRPNRPIIPFSEVFEARRGYDLERAILIQLSAQRERTSFLVHGYLLEEGKSREDYFFKGFDRERKPCLLDYRPREWFNIVVFSDGDAVLADAYRPLAKDATGKITRKCTLPIRGIEEGHGEIVVPQEWKEGRTYTIF
jgi:hypothetical protein